MNSTNMTTSDLAVALRPVTPEDDAFIRAVYGSTREAELALVPWDAAMKQAFIAHQCLAQLTHYAEKYPTATHSIILFDGQPVGRLYLNRGELFFHIADVTVLPAFRARGIGGRILRDLIAEADAAGRGISVYVETFSPPSQTFFERYGFHAVSEIGIHRRMERTPGAAPSHPASPNSNHQ